ncbi:efflux RND transporter periplasmic adaptor subunit [Silvibacterium acidisoli]|uniref:efflux RND transporter periplasmic adaptor subunit n=1 Tax=Acidobacteriaceae bacterium ZG23-2 TaxID=2883246 RepID=UPI00406C43A9
MRQTSSSLKQCGYEVLWTLGGASLLGALVLVAGCGGDAKPAGPGAGMPPGGIPVSVVTAETSDVPVNNQWVAALDGFVNAQIQPQVTGYLVEQKYREGSQVRKGDVLFQIDPRPFQAALDQANGQLGQAKGQLAQANAQEGLAQINVNRDTPLAQQRAIAQSQLDNDTQQLKQAQASVEAAKAQIATAQANIETAQLNLGFTHVRSLINGVAGVATTQVGNLVSPQSTLTSVSQLDPIKVYFSVSDAEYLALVKRGQDGHGDLLKGAKDIPLTLTLSDGTIFPHKGKVIFVDREINQQTGAIRIAASFDNPGNVLRPGQYGRVSADVQTLKHAILVPQIAVNDLQGVKQIYTVSSDNKVHIANVTLGEQSGPNWVVSSGIAPGTRVITDQLQKLKEGMPVDPHAGAPANASSTAQKPTAGE